MGPRRPDPGLVDFLFLCAHWLPQQGISTALIEATIRAARKAGVPALEAYPLDGGLSPSATGTGYLSTFQRAGFIEVGRRSPARPIMRLPLD